MTDDNQIHSWIASTLIGVVKLIKAIRYYPPQHPALEETAQECIRRFQPLLAGNRYLSLTIRKQYFMHENQVISNNSQVLKQLALFCFARRIQFLTFLPDLTLEDLNHFVHYLNLDAYFIQEHGGIQVLLEKARVTTIWVNIQDLDSIFDRRRKLERMPPRTNGDPMTVLGELGPVADTKARRDSADLFKLLKKLEQEKDDGRFRHGLQELIPLLRLNLKAEKPILIRRALLLLCHTASSAKFSATRQEHAKHALGQLASEEMICYLIEELLDAERDEKSQQSLIKILAFLGERVITLIMEKLTQEQLASRRKLLAKVLIRSGSTAVPTLLEHLFDDRWYVVRNAITILGVIRCSETVIHLAPMLDHKEVRVQLETVRALTKIGDQRAIAILMKAADSGNQVLRRQALLSLGAIKASAAVPTLLKLLRQPAWSKQAIEIKKDALRALSEIRSPEAIPDLVRIATQKKFFKKNLFNELRVAAIHALGETGDENARSTLEKITEEKSLVVARAAAQALKHLGKVTL